MSDLDNALAKTVLVRDNFGRSWLEGRNSHIRVRVAMYGVLLLLVVLGALRGVLSQQWQDERQLDIEILQSVAEQRVTAQRLELALDRHDGAVRRAGETMRERSLMRERDSGDHRPRQRRQYSSHFALYAESRDARLRWT